MVGACELSIVIPASDGRAVPPRVLEAVRAAAGERDEVILVDRGAGPAAARNEGARRASAPVVVFVDSDVEVHPDALERIRVSMRDDPALTAVFGSYDDSPACTDPVSLFRNLLHHHVHQQGAGPTTTFWAGLGAVRRDAFLAAGGFDAGSYPRPMMEDVELGMRLTRRGGRIELDPRLRGKHLKRWTLREMLRTDLTRRGIPWVRLLLRERQGSSALNLAPLHRVSALLAAGIVACLPRGPRRLVALQLALFAALNRRFYLLLLRRGGGRAATAGLALHLVHHLTAVVSLAVGVAAHAATTGGGRMRPRG